MLTSETREHFDCYFLENVEIYELDDLNNYDLSALRIDRRWSEFCYAAGPIFMDFLANKLKSGEVLGYIDADCFFYNDINLGLLDLNESTQIQIHEHRFSNDRSGWEEKSGRFNVGLVLGLIGIEFRSCLKRWSKQVQKNSSIDFDLGVCGDQKYLDEWPQLYRTLGINEHLGIGVGPWNLNNSHITTLGEIVFVDKFPLIFYHFHGLEIYYMNRFVTIWRAAPGYNLNRNDYYPIYCKYIKSLMGQLNANNNIRYFCNKRISTRLTIKNAILRRFHISFVFR